MTMCHVFLRLYKKKYNVLQDIVFIVNNVQIHQTQ